jgi:uncharacterized cupredoxin-like copper-binding protein
VRLRFSANRLLDLMRLSYARVRRQGSLFSFGLKEIAMQKLLLPMIGILTMALANGCDSVKSPAAVASDVANARQQASTEVTDAKKGAAKEVDSTKVDHTSNDANVVGAKASYDVAFAQADGDHNVAIQQCSAMTGAAQKSCNEKADAKYEQAKTHANVIRLSANE